MIRKQADLAITATVAAAACGAAALGAPVALMTVLGIVLFATPGYLLCQILLGSNVSGLERLAAICGLSLCVPIIGGLLMHAARVPLHRASWLGLLAGVTIACDLALLARHLVHRRSNMPLSGLQRPRWRLPTRQAAAFAAAVVIAACGVGLASAGAAKQSYPGFTQLWLVHRQPNAPTASLGVTNDEGKTVRYKLILFYDTQVAATWDLNLSNGQTWQRATKFTSSYTITAKLYRLPDISSAYRYVVIDGPRNQARPRKQTSPRNQPHGRSAHRH
jgi:uncharacterized membrane protein